jgi:hypothetical protein
MWNLFKRKQRAMNKKGSINMLIGGAIAFVVLFVSIAVGQLIMTKIGDNPTVSGDTNATQSVNDGKTALSDLSSLSGILVFVLFLAVVVGFFGLLGYGAYRSLRK